jgi:hypothetical protein
MQFVGICNRKPSIQIKIVHEQQSVRLEGEIDRHFCIPSSLFAAADHDCFGSKAEVLVPQSDVSFGSDIVAKVENRTTLKISRKLIFGLLCCCVAFQRHYGGP